MQIVVNPSRWALPGVEAASGCFETMRVYAGKIFRLDAHLDRLAASAKYLGVKCQEPLPRLRRRLLKTLNGSEIPEAIVRVALIPTSSSNSGAGRPNGRPARAERSAAGGRVASASIVVQPVQLPAPEFYARGIRVAVVPTRKFPVSQIDPQAKFSSRLGSILAVMESQLRRADEAILMDAMGYVTESTASNLGVIKGGAFLAPPCWLGLLAGITWQAMVEAAARAHIAYRETPLTRHDLYNADEAFLSSTIKEVLPVTTIDGRRIGTGRPGPFTQRLHRAFRQLVREELHGRH